MDDPQRPIAHLAAVRVPAGNQLCANAEAAEIEDIAWTPISGLGNEVDSPAHPLPISTVQWDGSESVRLLSPVEVARADAIKSPHDKATYCCAHALLRVELARHLGTLARDIPLEWGPFGKPRVKGAGPLHFSVSYRRGWAVATLAEFPVGVDIEPIRKDDSLFEVAARCFHPQENAYLARFSGKSWTRHFFDIWTRKEALIKAAGLGVDYMLAVNTLKSHARSMDENGIARNYRIYQFESALDISLALAIQQSAQ